MSEEIDQIKGSLNIKDVIMSTTGLVMHRNGKHLEKCPFCDHKGCFSIMNDERQAYKCHSASCNASGDVIIFLEEYHRVDRGEAIRKAADLGGVKLKSRSTAQAVQESIKDRIFRAATDYYHKNALEGAGIKYFVERRQHDERLVKSLKLGYSDGRLLEHLKGLNYTPKDIVDCGLATKLKGQNGKSGEEHYIDYFPRDCAIFPHFDHAGRIIHITQKDADPKRSKTDKVVKHQLRNEHRDRDWKFYNQKALRGDSFIVVEGENDLLAIMSAGFSNGMAIIGSLAEYQIKDLQDNSKHKDVFLWFDKDDAGKGYIERVCKAMREASYSVKIIEHPGEAKDSDEYLKAFKGDPRKEILYLMDKALDYTHWQLRQMAALKDVSELIVALKERKMFSTISAMPRLDRLPYIDVLKSLGLDEDTIKEQLEVNRELRDAIGVITSDAGGMHKADPYKLTRVIYEHFEANGKFFRDREHNVYLLYQNRIYEIGNNRPFNALMDKSGGLLVNRAPGPQVWEALANKGYNDGKQISMASWISTKERTSAIYINFNAEDSTILKISPEGIKEVPNGLNEDDVLLKSSAKIEPLSFMPGASIRESLEAVKTLILDSMTCDIEQRYLIICWAISAFLLDFMPYQAIMKFSGGSASGKSTAAKLLSKLIYNKEELVNVSSAAAYSLSSQNPMVILDNLEESDRGKALKMFLLLCATGGAKEKRAGGTDSETIQEKPKSLVLITAIEPLEEPELINRTVDIEFSKKWKRQDFVESSVLRAISKQRDSILSDILKLIQADILPNLEEGIQANLTILKEQYNGHSKDRSDEYLALLMLILKKILPHMPLHGKNDDTEIGTMAAQVWGEWIGYQNRQAREDETLSNNILFILDGIAAEYTQAMADSKYEANPKQPWGDSLGQDELVAQLTLKDFLLSAEKTQTIQITAGEFEKGSDPYYQSWLQFTCTSNELVSAMGAWCKDKGRSNPYKSAAQFMKRLMNDLDTLKRGGWTLIIKDPDKRPYSKIVSGKRYLTLRKELVR